MAEAGIQSDVIFDEMRGFGGDCRSQYRLVRDLLERTPAEILRRRCEEAEALFRRTGITFAVYSEGGDRERLIPFDIIPRVLDAREWSALRRGLEQRVKALNAFIADVYGGREILRAGRVPSDLVLRNEAFVAEMQDLVVPHGVYTHVAGIDVVRTGPEEFHVLEDNCRTPSGVSYMLENREVMMRLFPDLFAAHPVLPIAHYPEELLDTLRQAAPPRCQGEPTVVVLTPGSFNSAYYEHCFLADEMGVDLVEGADLMVVEEVVHMRTTEGLRRVDVIYRRVDDAFLDPSVFRPESVLGVPGLIGAYRAGNVAIANAVGAGIADDKAVYIHVPEMIRFYLGEEPVLHNVPTWDCSKPEELAHVLAHLDSLVVKEVHGSGGIGMLVGPAATAAERERFASRLQTRPENYIAQPMLALSTCPTFVGGGIAPRHVDLRPFVLCGKEINIVPGGLTRVAMREGSVVVNSSQGGGTKDTLVIATGDDGTP